MSFYTFHRHSLLSWSCGLNLQLIQLVGRLWVFFLSHTACGFQLWFYFHLYMWVIHWGLLLRLPWRAWVCPCEGQVWRWCSCLGSRESGSTRYSKSLAARAAGNMATRRVWLPVLANTLQYSCLENSLSDREAWQATVYSVTKSQTRPKRPCRHRCKTFFACGSSAPLWVECESGEAALLAGTLAGPSVQGHGLPPPQELWPFHSPFSSLL